MPVTHTTVQSQNDLRLLGLQFAAGQLGNLFRTLLALYQCQDHLSGTYAVNVTDHTSQTNTTIVQNLV